MMAFLVLTRAHGQFVVILEESFFLSSECFCGEKNFSVMKTCLLQFRVLFALALFFLLGCGGTASKGARDSGNTYAALLGQASPFDFGDLVRQALDKYQFQVSRYDETNERVYLETQWKLRRLFDDEETQGVVEAQTRLILETRPRLRSGGTVKLSNVYYRAENKVLFETARDIWVNAPLSPMCHAYLQKIGDELKDKFTATMRRY